MEHVLQSSATQLAGEHVLEPKNTEAGTQDGTSSVQGQDAAIQPVPANSSESTLIQETVHDLQGQRAATQAVATNPTTTAQSLAALRYMLCNRGTTGTDVLID